MDKILIIEDDVEINTLLTDFLKENGYVVYSQYDGLHVLDFLHKENLHFRQATRFSYGENQKLWNYRNSVNGLERRFRAGAGQTHRSCPA